MKYICIRCGKEFEAKHKTAVCADCHTAVCIVCEKEFELQTPWTQKTCSSKCRGVYRKQSGIAQSAAAKAKSTLSDKYGVTNPGELAHTFNKICKWCGKEFTTTSSRQIYCDDTHYSTCVICGSAIEISDMSSIPQTCSTKCKSVLVKKTSLAKYGSECVLNSEYGVNKRKQTCQSKYGVDNYSQTAEFKQKFKETSLSKYGTEYPVQSKEIQSKIAKTNIERYGGISPMCSDAVKAKAAETASHNYGGFGFQSEELKERILNTMLEVHGVDNPMKSDVFKAKAETTNLARYGVSKPMQSEDIKAKAKQTSISRYGTEHPSQSEDIKAKVASTVMKHYGVANVFQSPQIQELIRSTLVERYGVDNPMKSQEFQAKAQSTNLSRYGSIWYNSSKRAIAQKISDPSKAEQFLQFKTDPKHFIESHYIVKPTLTQVSKDTGVDIATISYHILQTNLQDLIDYHTSSIEVEVIDFIKSIDSTIEVQQHIRSIIAPYEFDIYLPKYHLAIECNPTITHNSSFTDPWGGDPKSYKYHQIKSLMAADKDVFLFHIFGYEWTWRKDVIKSMLTNLLHLTPQRIYARNCKISSVSDQDCMDFLSDNHRQGGLHTNIRLGLYYQDELVSIMTFNKVRSTIGSKVSEDTWELSRFCNKLNTSVIGGASKLFKYYVTNYQWSDIISYSDVAHTQGKLYQTLGFVPSDISNPGYGWVELSTDKFLNRVKCQKQNLHKLFNDVNVLEDMTERSVMEAHGYAQVFDSGTIRWTYSFGRDLKIENRYNN